MVGVAAVGMRFTLTTFWSLTPVLLLVTGWSFSQLPFLLTLLFIDPDLRTGSGMVGVKQFVPNLKVLVAPFDPSLLAFGSVTVLALYMLNGPILFFDGTFLKGLIDGLPTLRAKACWILRWRGEKGVTGLKTGHDYLPDSILFLSPESFFSTLCVSSGILLTGSEIVI